MASSRAERSASVPFFKASTSFPDLGKGHAKGSAASLTPVVARDAEHLKERTRLEQAMREHSRKLMRQRNLPRHLHPEASDGGKAPCQWQDGYYSERPR
eukprot:CAMPEP_0171104844 /NCGR_PEP_ID=MMETSP0766_2-20121228/61441_1 /TAXON_ID=439317 /ORGANISM="Gambierdiscus australes, Strain CAWD 149" /LENGTH=98 /DNA_ID=CAMNT_0011565543 /DNA_START=107 /DNA_END=403 /DNA_ORIENTATION=-